MSNKNVLCEKVIKFRNIKNDHSGLFEREYSLSCLRKVKQVLPFLDLQNLHIQGGQNKIQSNSFLSFSIY